jgi:hypothetical protein
MCEDRVLLIFPESMEPAHVVFVLEIMICFPALDLEFSSAQSIVSVRLIA